MRAAIRQNNFLLFFFKSFKNCDTDGRLRMKLVWGKINTRERGRNESNKGGWIMSFRRYLLSNVWWAGQPHFRKHPWHYISCESKMLIISCSLSALFKSGALPGFKMKLTVGFLVFLICFHLLMFVSRIISRGIATQSKLIISHPLLRSF